VVDLAAVVFNRQGQFMDVVHVHKPTALMGAICTHREPSMWPEECQAVPGDDVVHVLPKKLEPGCEAIVLVASVGKNPGRKQDLRAAPKLEFAVTFADDEEHRELKFSVPRNLLPLVPALVDDGKAQSIILAVCYLDQPGWTVRYDLTGSAHTSWAHMIPDLQAALVKVKTEGGADLDCARALMEAPPKDDATLPFSRQYEDNDLVEAASVRLPDPAAVSKLRLDVGWKFWGKTPEDEIENTAVEFVIKFYNAAGEEVQSAGTNEREAQGVVVGRPEPEEAEEAEPEPEPEPEEEEEKAEGEEGEGEEGGEPKEPPPPPPEPAEDPYEFKQRDVAFIELKELPKDVRCAVVLVSNYGGAGFLPLRHAGVKLWDVSGGEEAARPLGEWHHLSKFEAEQAVTQVAMLKFYKEYDDSAWNVWKRAGADTVDAFVSGQQDAVLDAIKGAQAALKAFKEEEAKALAAAEESGEELTTELRKSTWRFSVLGLAMGGESLDAAEHDIKNNVLNYDGPGLRSLEARACECARVQFPGEKPDTYFGGYANDAKEGPGVYAFASGAFYVGHYKAGKREGDGIMLMPDGGLYIGQHKADRFDGTGTYIYPDGSNYHGDWVAGQKHGQGTYWDTSKGCLRGEWRKGVCAGTASYDQPALRFDGEWVAGVPAGTCTFTVTAHRLLDMGTVAAAHILDNGPTLRGPGAYAIPAGSGDDPKLDEEGQPIEDPDKPPLPTFPKYEGLGFTSVGLPHSVADVDFPPVQPPIPGVPKFSVTDGLVAAQS